MALQEYIASSDITFEPILRVLEESGDPTYLDKYIARANEWYEDHAQEMGVTDYTTLSFPVPFQALEVLNYYVAWKFGEGNQNLNVSRIAIEDVYDRMDDKAFSRWRNLKVKLTKAYITGDVTTTGDRAVSFGKMERVS